jgi:hypothetical protein
VSQYIRTREGVPTIRDFASGEGTPIVIDVLTGIAYYLYKNIVFQIVGGQTISTNAFSFGFSDGFANGP